MTTQLSTPLPEPSTWRLTEARLCHWIAHAKHGETIEYHTGLLMRDRAKPGSALPAKDCQRLDRVASTAWKACERALVLLFSQKMDEDHYRYIAVRSRLALRPAEIRARLRQPMAEPLPEVA